MGRADEETATAECGDSRIGQQDGTDDLGGSGTRSAVPNGVREREAGLIGDCHVEDQRLTQGERRKVAQ